MNIQMPPSPQPLSPPISTSLVSQTTIQQTTSVLMQTTKSPTVSLRVQVFLQEYSRNISTGLSQIMKLNPVSYTYKASVAPGDSSTHLGFIAEEVDTVNKTLVDYDAQGLPHSVKYTEFIPLLTKAVQEQQNQINTSSKVFVLDKENSELKHIQMASKNGVLWCVSINEGVFEKERGPCTE
jgi:hypothetical protein